MLTGKADNKTTPQRVSVSRAFYLSRAFTHKETQTKAACPRFSDPKPPLVNVMPQLIMVKFYSAVPKLALQKAIVSAVFSLYTSPAK